MFEAPRCLAFQNVFVILPVDSEFECEFLNFPQTG